MSALSIIGCNNRETLNGPAAAALRGYQGSKADQLNQAEVFQAAGGIHQLMRGHCNRDGETVGGGAGVNATIVHQGHFDLVEDDCDTTAVKLLGQVPESLQAAQDYDRRRYAELKADHGAGRVINGVRIGEGGGRFCIPSKITSAALMRSSGMTAPRG